MHPTPEPPPSLVADIAHARDPDGTCRVCTLTFYKTLNCMICKKCEKTIFVETRENALQWTDKQPEIREGRICNDSTTCWTRHVNYSDLLYDGGKKSSFSVYPKPSNDGP